MNNLEILVKEMLPLRKSGVDFFEIRKKLEERGLCEEEIKWVIERISDREIEDLQKSQPRWVSRIATLISIALIIAGVILLVYCFFAEWSIMLFALGVLIAGGGIMVLFTAKSNQQRLDQMGKHTRFKQ